MLQVQEAKTLLTFEQRHVSQITLIEVKSIGICIPFRRLPIDNQNAWNLRKLSKNNLVFIFNSSDDSVFQKVSISLVLLTRCEFCEKLSEILNLLSTLILTPPGARLAALP